MHAPDSAGGARIARAWSFAIAAAPLALLAAAGTLKLAAPTAYARAIAEDGPVEWLQVAAYGLAALVAAAEARRARRDARRRDAIALAAVAVALALVVGEELSWGQRAFRLGVPTALAQANEQGELTLHNLRGMSYVTMVGFVVVGAAGAAAHLASRRLAGRWPGLARYLPGRRLALYFLAPAVTYAAFPLFQHVGYELLGLAALRRGGLLDWRDQEPAELLLAAGVLLALLEGRHRREAAAGAAAAAGPRGPAAG